MLLAAFSLRSNPQEYLRRRAADPDAEWDLKMLGMRTATPSVRAW